MVGSVEWAAGRRFHVVLEESRHVAGLRTTPAESIRKTDLSTWGVLAPLRVELKVVANLPGVPGIRAGTCGRAPWRSSGLS